MGGMVAVDMKVFRVQDECMLSWQEVGESSLDGPRSHVVGGDGFDREKWEESGV